MAFDEEQLIAELRDRAEALRAGQQELAAIQAALAVLEAGRQPEDSAAPQTNRGRVLAAVKEAPGSRAADIARAVGVTPTTARTHLVGLQATGEADKDDSGGWSCA